jgi:hypothetical protein
MRKMKDLREMDRKSVLTQIENVQSTLMTEQHMQWVDASVNVIENALSIVNRNKASLAVGCRMKGNNIS